MKDIDIELFENELNTKTVESLKDSISKLELIYNENEENKNKKGNLISMLR
jgi:hypothetical protein